MIKTVRTLCALLVLSACSAAGVMESGDPAVKLEQAQGLLKSQRAIPAERLVKEAIGIYEKQGDKVGLAKAYMVYGLMITSDTYKGYGNSVDIHEQNGKVAISYMEKALSLSGQANDPEGQRFASIQLARLYKTEGYKDKSCRAYDMSSKYHAEARAKYPSRVTFVPPKYINNGGWDAMVTEEKAQVPCQ